MKVEGKRRAYAAGRERIEREGRQAERRDVGEGERQLLFSVPVRT